MPHVTGVLETCIHVEDIARSADFYERLFGFRRLGSDERFCAFDVAGRDVLILFRRGGTSEPVTLPGGVLPHHGGSGRLHFAFAIPAEDLRAREQRLGEGQNREPSEMVAWRRKPLFPRFRRSSGGTCHARHLGQLLALGVITRSPFATEGSAAATNGHIIAVACSGRLQASPRFA